MFPKEEYSYASNYTQKFRIITGDTYKGYPVIGRDIDVRGGIYFGLFKHSSEAIVVGPEANPEIYRWYFEESREMSRDEGDLVEPSKILPSVYATVQENMRYSKRGVWQIRQRLGPDEGDVIDLGAFMEAGVGVCRHQALACAATLEAFKEFGYLHGDISVDRNHRWYPGKEHDDQGHAWVRYTSTSGKIYIIDVAQNYIGSLEKSIGSAQWNYLRPEESYQPRRSSQKDMGKTALRRTFEQVSWYMMGD